MKRLILLWSNLGIHYKLFAAVLFAVALPFAVLLYIHLNMSASDSKQQANQSAHKVMEETKSYLEYKADSIHEVLNFISFNDIVQQEASRTNGYEDVNEWLLHANRIDKALRQFPYNEEIKMIRLYLKAGLAGEAGNRDYLLIDHIADRGWLKHFKESREYFYWLPSTELDQNAPKGEISILRKIPEEHSIIQFSGLSGAAISASSLQSVLDHAKLTTNSSAFLFNKRGDLLSTSTSVSLPEADVLHLADSIPESNGLESRWQEHVTYKGRDYLVGQSFVQNMTMKLVIIIPESDIMAAVYQTRNQLISIFLIIVPFVLPLSYFVAGSSTKRLRQLSRHMRRVKDGDFSLTQLVANKDEIGQLIYTYNAMVVNIGKLLDETYQLGREVKNKELKALQAQINPHFLYNTLDLINIMAIETDEKDTSTVVEELAVFYKLSLSNGQEKISLCNELKHVEAYVRIQNMRFGGSIDLRLEIAEEAMDIEVPKIILQPLVENSILHGIREKDNEEGTIHISAVVSDEGLLLRIQDDGVGMDAKQLAGAVTGRSSKRTGGFGVRNIQERIVLLFGAEYGLDYESTPGVGTRVTIKLPSKVKKD
ncbi:sensor histidine kinase [Paenibacillus sp. 2TAB23]|uniref:cache domain-containing sensor histidine kinase n=1 Tax=Paenibacillus sp. 2TAB23 TaxID=3233004 RepID=UPI003F9AE9BA